MNRHHIKAVLFDLDGVLVFTDRFHEAGWRRLAEDEGWKFSPDLAHSLRGVSRMEALDVILERNGVTGANPEQKEAWADRKNAYYKESVAGIGAGDVLPGSLEFVRALRAQGVRIALCSASKNAPDVLRLLGIGDLFDTVVCGFDITRSKPDPQVFSMAAERLGIPAFHCLVFEDAPSGVEAAKRAGMKCVGVGDAKGLPDAPSVISHYNEIDIEALLDSGRPFRPEPHGWNLVEGPFRPTRSLYWESMFAVTNGVLGVCGNLEEGYEGSVSYPATLLNGLVGYIPYSYMWAFPGYPPRGHCVLNVCEWTHVSLTVDGTRFSLALDGIKSHRRWLNMHEGVLHREIEWTTPKGVNITIRTRRMASMERRHTALMTYEVSADAPCAIVIESLTDFSPKSRHFGKPGMDCKKLKVSGDLLLAESESNTSGQKVAIGIRHRAMLGALPAATELSLDGSTGTARVEGAFKAAGRIAFEKTAVIFCDLESPDPRTARDAELADLPDGKTLLAGQAEFWKKYWAIADVEIEGDPLDQLGVRLSLFHNRQSNPEDGFRSVGANGQTGDNYGGHVFWDTEQYILPPMLYTEPQSVRGLLEYRYRILDKAREQARLMQGTGAEYSWNSITGEECGHVFEAAQGQVHLQSDVAWAIDRYVEATGDREFLHDMGAEIVFETARYLKDRGAFSQHKGGQFVLNAVCGPNEYSCGVDNNAYTNYMAKWHFQYAVDVFEKMKAGAPAKLAALAGKLALEPGEVVGWREASEKMYLPWDEATGVVPQDDNFLGRDPVDMAKVPLHTDVRSLVHPLVLWKNQWIKQADAVLLMFMQRHQFDAETVCRTYEFHEPKTNHGSSLSASVHSIVAADIGKLEDAYHFFRESALMDINDLKSNTGGGVHSACLGGTWMAVVNGFGGMRDDPDGLRFRPQLPSRWTRLAFQIVWRGTHLGIEIVRDVVKYRHLDGPEIIFRHGDQTVSLAEKEAKEFAL